MSKLSQFSNKEIITRSEIVTLTDIVGTYTELNDIELKLVRDFKDFLRSVNITEEQAETSDDFFKPSQIEHFLEKSGKIIDDTLEKFKRVKLQYPTNPKVVQFLDFVDQAGLGCQSDQSKGSKPGSTSSAGGIDSLRNKVSKNKADFDKRFDEIKKQYDDVNAKRDLSFYQSLKRQIERLETKCNITFDKLSDKLEAHPDAEDEDISSFEDYSILFSAQIESLLEQINKQIDSLKDFPVNKKSDYSTFFKKQDPPCFKGDCIDYMEWKKGGFLKFRHTTHRMTLNLIY